MDSGIKFKAVDMPHANELTIHIMSAIAQNEAKVISQRIKDALAQSDKELGTPANLTLEAKKKGLESILKTRRNNPRRIRAIAFLKSLDYKNASLRELAAELNNNEFRTSNNKEFSATQVSRLIKAIG